MSLENQRLWTVPEKLPEKAFPASNCIMWKIPPCAMSWPRKKMEEHFDLSNVKIVHFLVRVSERFSDKAPFCVCVC